MDRKAPVPCPVVWPEPQSDNERHAGTSVEHSCALPTVHLSWPSALHPGPMDHVCSCGATEPVRDIEAAL